MNLRKGTCVFVLLTAVAVQPVLAAEGPAKPGPARQSLELANIPMKGLMAEDSAAGTVQSTRQEDVGFDPAELFAPPKATCPPSGNATFTYTIIDGCPDGLGVYTRFFDETNGIVFPNTSQVYVINSGRSTVFRLSVKRGAKICYGAEPTDLDGSYWGVSLDDSQFCSACCNTVPNSGNISRSVRLTC